MRMKVVSLETMFWVPGFLEGSELQKWCRDELKNKLEDVPHELTFVQAAGDEVDLPLTERQSLKLGR